MNTFKGSPEFMAPEIFSEKEYTYKSDIFSYSILMYMLLTNKDPYSGYRTAFKLQTDVSNGKRPDLSYVQDEHLKSLISKCWSSDPKERPDFDHIVEELKEERYRELMKANYEEVSQYLRLFDDELPKRETMTKKAADIKRKADDGDSSVMNNYGLMLEHGDGVPVNKEEAARYYKMAAEKGNPDEMNRYAKMLEKGDGIPANREE